MADYITVYLGDFSPIALQRDRLRENSSYFRRIFDNNSITDVAIPWRKSPALCALFLLWLGNGYNPIPKIGQECALQCLKLCDHFEVNIGMFEEVQQTVVLPKTYDGLSKHSKAVWGRKYVPMDVMWKIVQRVPNEYEQFIYVIAWVSEKNAQIEKLKASKEFKFMRKFAQRLISTAKKRKRYGNMLNICDMFGYIARLFAYPICAGEVVRLLQRGKSNARKDVGIAKNRKRK